MKTKVIKLIILLFTIHCSLFTISLIGMGKFYPRENVDSIQKENVSSTVLNASTTETGETITKQQTIPKQTSISDDKKSPMAKKSPSAQEVKLGINLNSLPIKRDFNIGFISPKGLPGTAERYIPAAEDLTSAIDRVKFAINTLLQGLTEEEKRQGYVTYIPEGTKLLNCELLVDDVGVLVYLEFSEEMIKDINEEKNVFIQDQIRYTLISLDIPKIYGTKIFVKGKSLGYYANQGK